MYTGTTLVLEFGDANNNSIFFFFNYADDDAATNDIKNAMNAFISNGSIFKNPPVSIKSAKTFTTTVSEFSLS